jgi:hypothetical protein
MFEVFQEVVETSTANRLFVFDDFVISPSLLNFVLSMLAFPLGKLGCIYHHSVQAFR